MSLRTLCTVALVASCIAVVAPTVASADANAEQQQVCTFCSWNPYTYQLVCFTGATIGDTACHCWAHNCALV